MNTNILVSASALSDHDLLARLEMFAGSEREATAELVAHLAAFDSRRSLFAAQGYGSLFSYCTQTLRLSEDAACNRIEAARACRRFPVILDLLASGSLSLTSVRLLTKHLTAENHESILARALDKTRREIEALVAELAPRPDILSAVRKVPCRNAIRQPATGPRLSPGLPTCPSATREPATGPGFAPGSASVPGPGREPSMTNGPSAADAAITSPPSTAGAPLAASPSPQPATPRPIVQASAPERYYVRFTIGEETHEKLRRLQALLRREIPDGDPGAIFDRALTALLEKVEKTKLAAAAKPRPSRPIGPETDPKPPIRPATDRNPLIRPWTDREVRKPGMPSFRIPLAPPAPPSRTVPREVKREVWRRDAGQCAFVATTGRRCTERTFLEFHHVQPFAKQGPATVANISLRCWRHNHYEGELIFGPHRRPIVCEAPALRPGPSGPRRTIDSL